MKLKKLDIGMAEKFITKTITVLEDINKMQAEKDSVVESYERVKQEYSDGRISRDVFVASVERMNSEIEIIDSMIEEQINISGITFDAMMKFIKLQKPVKLTLGSDKILR